MGIVFRWTLLLILLAGVAAMGAWKEEPKGEAHTSLESLAWMTGYWVGEEGGTRMEECWLAPRNGLMLGVHRDAKGKAFPFFEYLRIQETQEGIVYHASPMGKGLTPFALLHTSKHRVEFANPAHDFPQKISYWLDSKKALHARVEGVSAGKTRHKEWIWRGKSLPSSW